MKGTTHVVNPGFPLVRTAAALLFGVVLAGCGAPGRKADAQAKPRSTAPAAAAAAAAAGSMTPGAFPAGHPLAGTAWRLLEIQSMDDSTGTTRVDDPSKYTMTLSADGSVALRLNCNSASGSWSAEAAGSDPSSGRFQFGPLAATMAMCPPPSVDEQVTKQAPYLRSYLLKDGRLYLSLMADGDIFVWAPVESGR
jgi:heat shock protein HslJ